MGNLTADLAVRTCPRCGAGAKEVIYAEKHIRKGWYCTNCGKFEAALGRERRLK